MVLRVPSTVGDKSLLQDEPFKSRFEEKILERRGHGRSLLFKRIEESMKSTTGGVRSLMFYDVRQGTNHIMCSSQQQRHG